MKKVRKYTIGIINILLVLLIIKAYFFDPVSDTNGVFSLFIFLILLCFNLYAVFLYTMFGEINSNKYYIEFLFYILLLLPFGILYYLSML